MNMWQIEFSHEYVGFILVKFNISTFVNARNDISKTTKKTHSSTSKLERDLVNVNIYSLVNVNIYSLFLSGLSKNKKIFL